jgi:Cu-Zn family superoxide dismutase
MKNLRWSVFFCLVALVSLTSVARAQDAPPGQRAQSTHAAEHREEFSLPAGAVAVLVSTQGNTARGVIRLQQVGDGVHVTGIIAGLEPGLHGFHIHEFGDRRDPMGAFAGAHYDPNGHRHGGPGDEEHHAGDLGNVEANEDGEAEVDVQAPWLILHHILGRSIVVHAGPDDLKSQPSGDSGGRVAVGVIGIAQPPQNDEAAPGN